MNHLKEYFWLNVVLVGIGEKRSNHPVYNVNYHFVWCPKYRHAILEPIEESLEASFRDVCDEYDYEILSLHISPDHVHLFLSARPKWFERLRLSSLSGGNLREVRKSCALARSRESLILERHAPSEIVRTVKSITAREMWEQHEPFLENICGWWVLGGIVRRGDGRRRFDRHD